MKFSIEQGVAADPDTAALAYANPAFYEGREPRDNITVLEVSHHERTGDHARIDVRYRFSGAVSSAVRAVVDPQKMTWVTRQEIDLTAHRSRWTILPDHYPDRLEGSGTYTFGPGSTPDAAVVRLEGDLSVHVFLVARTVERVIVSGLRSYFAAEVATIPDVPPM